MRIPQRLAIVGAVAATLVAITTGTAQAATGSPSDPANLSDNPILATNLTGWQINAGGSALTRVAVTDHVSAAWAAKTTSSATTTRVKLPSEPIPTNNGQAWTYAADVKASQTGAKASISVEWSTSTGAFISYNEGTFPTLSATNWTRTFVTAIPPANAASGRAQVNVTGSAKNATVQITQHDVRSPVVAPPTTTTTTPPPTTTTVPPTTTIQPPPPPAITNRPPQPMSLNWAETGTATTELQYAHPGGLVVAGRTNYADPNFKTVSAQGGTVLIYLDPMIDATWGRYHTLMLTASECGAAVPRWPGLAAANEWGYLNDIRPGGILQGKMDCVLEKMVTENPHMAGFYLDDVGSRSWYPGHNWGAWSTADQQAYRDGAIALTQTARTVANRHGITVFVNGTWGGGTLANDGGGYPTMTQHGNALVDGAMVEHHDGQISYFGPYGCSTQWAAQSPVSQGKAFMMTVTDTQAGLTEFNNSNCYAYTALQPSAQYDGVSPWGSFHATGLPSKVAQ